jgi:tetratricopeptide (TPR) repeat protein
MEDMMRLFIRIYTRLLFVIMLSVVVQAQNIEISLTNEEISAFVDSASQMLIDKYVFEDVGQQVADYIRNRQAEGIYRDMTDPDKFTSMITADMQSISRDKHMRVRLRRTASDASFSRNPLWNFFEQNERRHEENCGFQRVEILENNIGYVDFRYFAAPDVAAEKVEAAMNFLNYSDALIFDMRKNGGGDPRLIQLVCSYLFSEKVHLNSLYWRQGHQTVEYWTLDELNGKRMPDVPVFVLTSNNTFSGAEEFTYNLKTRNRATIIGETTRGGANPGGVFPITEHLNIFIPTGRAINPVTGTNWEGTGVEPDIIVPADQAYDVAFKKAIDAAGEYRSHRREQAQRLITEISKTTEKAEKLASMNRMDDAEVMLNPVYQRAILKEVIDERAINSYGYDFLNRGKTEMAILIFRLNVTAYPDAFNTYDSLGEAYMKSGQKELAVANYKKSLELNPQNENARKMLEKLGQM